MKNLESCCKIILKLTLELFFRFPATRLGKLMRAESVEKMLELCDEFVPGEVPEYFFDKNPENFPAILDMYRTSTFHTTESGCALGSSDIKTEFFQQLKCVHLGEICSFVKSHFATQFDDFIKSSVAM